MNVYLKRFAYLLVVLVVMSGGISGCSAKEPVTPASQSAQPQGNQAAPAKFEVGTLDTGTGTLIGGKPVTVNAEIKNTGGIEGVYTARLMVDGKQAVSKDVTVAPSQSQNISLQFSIDAGAHTIEIGTVSKTINLLKPAQISHFRLLAALMKPKSID